MSASTARAKTTTQHATSKKLLFTIFCYICLAISLLILLFPVYSLIITSLKGQEEMSRLPPTFYPHKPTLSSFQKVLSRPQFMRYIGNSLFIALSTTLLSLIVSIPGGYSLARFHYAGREVLSTTILLAYMFPPILLVIPMFIAFYRFNLVDTFFALILAYTTFSLPFCVWVLRGFFIGIPKELEDAARIDGCNYMQTIRRIVLPLSAPGIATAAIFSFLLSWNNYLYALVFINSDFKRPVTVGLQVLLGRYALDYSLIMAACVILIAPPILIFFLFQRYIVKGLTAGAMKG